jgi:hypothetical protein
VFAYKLLDKLLVTRVIGLMPRYHYVCVEAEVRKQNVWKWMEEELRERRDR